MNNESLEGIKGAILSSKDSHKPLTQRPTRQEDDQLQSNEMQLRTLMAVSNAVTMTNRTNFILPCCQDMTSI